MSNDTSKAVVATVDLGFAKIDGLMLPDGSYVASIPQLADIKLIPSGRSIKQLESLYGKRQKRKCSNARRKTKNGLTILRELRSQQQ